MKVPAPWQNIPKSVRSKTNKFQYSAFVWLKLSEKFDIVTKSCILELLIDKRVNLKTSGYLTSKQEKDRSEGYHGQKF